MITIEQFYGNLKLSIEENSPLLRHGQLFLPEYLRGRVFTKAFKHVADTLARNLGLVLETEVTNEFSEEYKIDSVQKIDYVFQGAQRPFVYFELESLDGAQLMKFSDGAFDYEAGWNKFWYYYGTLGKYYTWGQPLPRFFVWLLILPERKVNGYHIWDADKNYQFFPPELKTVVYSNPYRFYDRQIKALARAFLRNDCNYFFNSETGEWFEASWEDYQQLCELVFITCTIDRLILSRGRDFFDRGKERATALAW